MRKLCLIMAVFISVVFGEQVIISNDIWYPNKDKDKVILNVKGDNKRTMGEELVACCIKYYKKKKRYRIGEEIKYYVRYIDGNNLIASCKFGDYDRDFGIYDILVIWHNTYTTSYHQFMVIEDKQTKKLEMELIYFRD